MTYNFGDSFDLYTAVADMAPTYWDTASGNLGVNNAGRFSPSKALSNGSSASLVKSSGVNDKVHHLAFSFSQSSVMGGANVGQLFVLLDGTTAQCSFGFRQDGAIVFYAGQAGTVLATYLNAFSLQSIWYAFEFEVVIGSGTTGSFAVRKNGNNVADFTATGLNTQASANAYANKLQLAMVSSSPNAYIDDLFWRRGATTGAWLGDIRCLTRMPVSDVQAQFSKSPLNWQQSIGSLTAGGTYAGPANAILFAPITSTMSGTVTNLMVGIQAMTGKMRMAVYDNTGTGGNPGNLLFSSVELTNPGTGAQCMFSATGVIQRGVQYWIAVWANAAYTITPDQLSNMWSQTLTYTGTFPSVATMGALYSNQGSNSFGWQVTPFNCGCVNEPQEDGLTTYLYDSNVGDADYYAIAAAAISATFNTLAVITRGYMEKSDAGTRTAAVNLKSGATVVATPTLALSSSSWQWTWRMDLTDPNTSAAWTAAAVSALQVGPTVIA